MASGRGHHHRRRSSENGREAREGIERRVQSGLPDGVRGDEVDAIQSRGVRRAAERTDAVGSEHAVTELAMSVGEHDALGIPIDLHSVSLTGLETGSDELIRLRDGVCH